jgi:hypothetical protein
VILLHTYSVNLFLSPKPFPTQNPSSGDGDGDGDGDGPTISPHIEAAFRKEYDELVEAWVAGGAGQDMARSMTDGMLAANMKHRKRSRSRGLANDNVDINEWRVADGMWTFRESMDFTRRLLLR